MFFKELRLLDIVFYHLNQKRHMEICKCCREGMQRLAQHEVLIQIYMEVKCIGKVKFGNQS